MDISARSFHSGSSTAFLSTTRVRMPIGSLTERRLRGWPANQVASRSASLAMRLSSDSSTVICTGRRSREA
jgi:hypothetical protein